MVINNFLISKKEKKGEILIENVVFLILNFLFLSILILFLSNQGGSGSLYEEAYSKNIALLVDSAKPGMIMKINVEKGLKIAKENGIRANDIIRINGNTVIVRLSSKKGRTYNFFNNVNVSAYPDIDSESNYNGLYVLVVNSK